jgi:protein-S-isoprenylcysteine O-methyltransferase Ste14
MLLFLKNLLFTILVPGTVAVYIPLWMARSRHLHPQVGLPQVAALVPFLLGAAIYFWCLWDFARHGRGTPAPIDAPKRLVVRGLYRFVRNPMYVGVLLVIAGWAAFFESRAILFYGLGVFLMFHLTVLVVEEPILARSFGESYEAYRRAVGRWVPRWPRDGS